MVVQLKKAKPFQPSAALQALAAAVNAKLPESAKVNFCGMEWPDGRIQTGVIFSFGVHRATRWIDEPPGDESVDKIVTQVKAWIACMPARSNWTDDPSEAAPGSW